MGCPACGTENPPTNNFCGGCGSPLAATCPACGQPNPPTNRFCGECGSALGAAGQRRVGTPAPAAPAPESYTPKHLAEKILASRAALEGERKQVTVLFADVVGSTELIQGLDPEDVQRLLDGAVKVMMDAVHRYEGTVSRALGDGIMALFGAPIGHEDHAVRACYAALAMQDALRTYAEEMRRAHGVEVDVRVGLNSGEVVVRLVSDDLHMDYTAVGQTVHLAARMEQAAAGGSIRLTAGTLALVEGYVQARSLGPHPIKGISQPVEVYELVGAGEIRTRLQASAVRGLTRFVGRQAELEAVHTALERAEAGRGQVVALVGEPGVGKSRLVWEVTQSSRVQGWTILEAGSVSYAQATPYLPLISLLRGYCRVEPSDDPEAIRDKLSSKLLGLGEELRPTLPAFLALLDVPTEDPTWDALDPPQRRRQTLDAGKRLLLRESQVQPLLVVFEDLHWVDEQTQALLDGLVETLPTARILLLVNYRPEYRHDWGNKTYYSQVRIDPLPSESAGELLHTLLGGDPALDPLKRLLIERTEGNPFFLEESVRTLVETGALVGERGAYRLMQDVPSIRVPATVQAVLAARIDRLSPEDKRLLQVAAVIGKDVPFALLRAIIEVPEDDVERSLVTLQAAEFLYETSLFPEPEYTFKHALTHEVAYGGLLQERRRALHGQVVEAVEQLYPDRLVEHVERLAQHAMHGERWDRAVSYSRQAGQKAMARSAHQEAVGYFEQALVAVPHLPQARETLEDAIDLRIDLQQALIPLAEFRRILGLLREAETSADALGDQSRAGQVSFLTTHCLWNLGEHDRAIEAGERTLAAAMTLGDLPLQVAASYLVSYPYRDRGNYGRAIANLKRTATALGRDFLRERFGLTGYPAVMSRALLAECLAGLGDFDEGTAYGEEALRIAETVDHPYSLAIAHISLGSLQLRRGDLPQAIPLLERGHRLCRMWDLPHLFPLVASALAYAYALVEQVADAESLLEQAEEVEGHAAARGTMRGSSPGAASRGSAYLLLGRADDATRVAGRALELAVQREERANLAWALRLLGEIAAQQDPTEADQAERHYRQALAVAEELGMRPLQAHCHLGLGRLNRRIGRVAKAQVELSRAVEMLRSMDMTHWLPEAQAELAAATGASSRVPDA